MNSLSYKPNINARGEHVEPEIDIVTISILTICLLFQRWILLKTTMRPFALGMMGYKNQKELDQTAIIGVEKFCKYGWHFIVYIMLLSWGVKLLSDSEWSVLSSGRIDDVWLGYPHSGREKPVLKAFFIAQISWYVHGLVESLMVDRLRSDFVMMLLHHVLAIALLCGSFWGNAHRVGVTVCVCQVRYLLCTVHLLPCPLSSCNSCRAGYFRHFDVLLQDGAKGIANLSGYHFYFSSRNSTLSSDRAPDFERQSVAVPWLQGKVLHTYLIWQLLFVWFR
jgi:hypothetical protein